jgi:ribosomal RNA assembly protein
MEESYYLEKDRIAPFVGKNGEQKKEFERKFNCKIDLDSETGKVTIHSDDAVNLFVMSNIIHAINYGHNPKEAMKLEDEYYVLDVIDVRNLIKNHDRLKTVMGRIIGKDGSTRRTIEEITKCDISVKDTKVSIIGPYENTILVHDALNMLIKGASHKSFYAYLEKNKIKLN